MDRTDFRNELQAIFSQARKEGKSKICVTSGDLHRRVGGYHGQNHRMPMCCSVMREEMQRIGGKIIQSPPKGNGATLIIEYTLSSQNQKQTNESGRGKAHEDEKTHEQQKPHTTPQQIFAYFNCPFPCDEDALKKAYREMISQYHPDKVAKMGAEIRELAEKKTKEIIDMYEKAIPYLKR